MLHTSYSTKAFTLGFYVFVLCTSLLFFYKAVILGPVPLLRHSVGLTYLLQSFLHPLLMNDLSLTGCVAVL
uniref:Uncharacterized protein n=1 Tax=Rhipicephalus pulchellus TaxID=72859 RepID=L7LVI8_RHIPC